MKTSTSKNNTRRKSDFEEILNEQYKGKIKLMFYPCCSFRELNSIKEALEMLRDVVLDFNERSFARVLDEDFQVIAVKSHKGIVVNERYQNEL